MELRRSNICRSCLHASQIRDGRILRSSASFAQQYTRRSYGNQSQSPLLSTAAVRGEKELRWKSRKPPVFARATTVVDAPRSAKKLPPSTDLNAIHARIQELAGSVLRPQDIPVPPEQRVLYVLEQLDSMAKGLVEEQTSAKAASNAPKQSTTATSALLGSVNARQAPNSVTKVTLLALISQTAEETMRHPNIFITPAILTAYVELQTLLQQPSSFPDVFNLYATKPIPTPSSSNTVEFSPAAPDKINTAIPSPTASTALSAAIASHHLPLAIDTITTSFCTPAFRKAKTLRQGLVPGTGLAIAPFAAYTLSSAFSTWQTMLDPQQATYMAFAGIMTYVSAVSMVGYVAITTANDQMDRVTWAQGVPLWERWVREEERAAIDRVAGAWGFKSPEKRGDEEGEEWAALREWVGKRGMVLDKVELMEGME